MKETSHTPGPWRIGIRPGPFIYGPKGEQVANMLPALMERCENIANARLIAAAPELLEALIALLKLNNTPSGCVGHFAIERKARAAIAKATGEDQP